MSKKLFLTGEPGAGKTTVLQKIVQEWGDGCAGFYAREIRENNIRTGFELVTVNLPIPGGPLAHVDFDTDFAVGRYKVDVAALDRIVAGMYPLLNGSKLLVIDEIGPMEAFSVPFRKFIQDALTASNDMLATIKLASTPWVDDIKTRYAHIHVKTAAPENRDRLPFEIINYFQRDENGTF